MYVGKSIQLRLAQEERMHQLSVVRDQRNPLAGFPFRVIDDQLNEALRSFGAPIGGHLEGVVQTVVAIIRVLALPPGSAAEEGQAQEDSRPQHGAPRPPELARASNFS